MNRQKRKTPLQSLEDVCNRNGIFFDKGEPYKPIQVVREDGTSYPLDKSAKLSDILPFTKGEPSC